MKSRTNNPAVYFYNGGQDETISLELAKSYFNNIKKLSSKVEFHEFPDATHALTLEELKHVYKTVNTIMPNQ